MEKTVYEVKRFSAEIGTKDRKNIKNGCCLLEDVEPETIKKFDTMEEAVEELKKHQPSCRYYSNAVPFYEVEEYVVDIHTEDEDGEFLCGSDFDSVYDYTFNEEYGDIEITQDSRFF